MGTPRGLDVAGSKRQALLLSWFRLILNGFALCHSSRTRTAMNKNAFLIKLSESPKTGFGRVAFGEQPQAQRMFSAVWALESEVNSGGFRSYLTGSEARTAAYAPEALRAIGAVKCAALVERALQIGPSGNTSAVDEEFMAYPENLTELLFTFVASHPEAFGPVGEAE